MNLSLLDTQKYSSLKTSKEIPKEESDGIPKEIPKEKSKKISKDVPKEEPKKIMISFSVSEEISLSSLENINVDPSLYKEGSNPYEIEEPRKMSVSVDNISSSLTQRICMFKVGNIKCTNPISRNSNMYCSNHKYEF